MKKLILLGVFGMFAARVAVAELEVGVGVTEWNWKEWVDGDEILEESGPVLNLQLNTDVPVATNLSIGLQVGAWFGDVDYDGQNQIGDPAKTTVQYSGIELEGLLQSDQKRGNWRLVPAGGIGIRAWLRELEDSPDALGYDEDWQSFYLKAGATLTRPNPTGYEWALGVFFHLPVYNHVEYSLEVPDYNGDIETEPESELGWEASLSVRKGRVAMEVFAERMEFGQSDDTVAGDYLFYQPESRADLYGARLIVEL